MAICSIEGCGKKHFGHGLCNMHYSRLRKYGTIDSCGRKTPKKRPLGILAVDEIFRSGFQEIGQGVCWNWSRAVDAYGYGQISITMEGGRKATRKAHRISYETFNGPIPDGMSVCHHCDNPACVNPSHLFLGSQADNMADKVRKGRQLLGEKHPQAKLTSADIRKIRCLAGDGIKHHHIAEEFGIARQTVSGICSKAKWGHISD